MTAKKTDKRKPLNNRGHIMARYGFMTLIFLAFCSAVIYKLAMNTVVDGKAWADRSYYEFTLTDTIAPERGSILSCNGNILSCNETLFDVRINLRHPKFANLNSRKWAAIDSLADSLDLYYPLQRQVDDTTPKDSVPSWRDLFHTELVRPVADRRKVKRVGTKLELAEFERMREWPFFNQISRKVSCPLYAEDHVVRVNPFGDMARLSIGRVYEDSITGRICGYAGLERALDSLLYGQPGVVRRVDKWIMQPARRGYDVITTIDIDMQDLVESELLDMCDSVRAQWGTAILMEVNTGEIKAISNVERDPVTGQFIEARNRAVERIEPGSVIKTISLMLAFEEGLIHSVNDMLDCSNAFGTQDHHGGGMKSVKEVLATSSNTGTAHLIVRKYHDHPEAWGDRLRSIGFDKPMHTGISGEQLPHISKMGPIDDYGRPQTMTARINGMARQAFGYVLDVPPMYTLSYYNAIANNGKYVRPHLVRALRDADGRDSILPITYIMDSVCSQATARKMRECLHEVVWGAHGTARRIQDDRVEIAGKTGTAIPYDYEVLNSYDHSKRRFAFAGFFPYDKPKYSCMVVICTDAGSTSAGSGAGGVLRNIATRLYAKGLLTDNPTSYTAQRAGAGPTLYPSLTDAVRRSAAGIGAKNARQIANNAAATPGGVVPDVRGMDAASAVQALERRGIRVDRINGTGRVMTQSLTPGTPLRRGSGCQLWLKGR